METDNTPQCVKDVLDKPGLYVFHSVGMSWAFEVDDKKHVFQLKPKTLIRDGLLSRTGWNLSSNLGKVEPLNRIEWLAQFE